MLSRVFVLCMAGGAAAADSPSCSGGACGGAEEVDEVQLLQTVVRAHGPAHSTVESALPKLMSYIAQAPTVESAFPKLMSYIAQEMSHELAASLPEEGAGSSAGHGDECQGQQFREHQGDG